MIEGVVDAGVEVVEGTTAVLRKEHIIGDRFESGSAEWRVNAMEEFQEQDADPEPFGVRRQVWVLGTLTTRLLARNLARS